MLAADEGRDDRQAGFVDRRGRAATHTGARCMDWAGGRTGAGYAAQGNILAGPGVVAAMAEAYEAARRQPGRAPAARARGRRCRRGRSPGPAVGRDRSRRRPAPATAATTTPSSTCASTTTRIPSPSCRRLYDIHTLLTGTTPEEQKLPLEGALADEVRELLARAGYPSEPGEAGLHLALRAFTGTENLEARWWHEPRLDPVVLAHLRTVAVRAYREA